MMKSMCLSGTLIGAVRRDEFNFCLLGAMVSVVLTASPRSKSSGAGPSGSGAEVF